MTLSSSDMMFLASLNAARTSPWETYARELQQKVKILESLLADARAESAARKTIFKELAAEVRASPVFAAHHSLLKEVADPARAGQMVPRIRLRLRDELGKELEALGYKEIDGQLVKLGKPC